VSAPNDAEDDDLQTQLHGARGRQLDRLLPSTALGRLRADGGALPASDVSSEQPIDVAALYREASSAPATTVPVPFFSKSSKSPLIEAHVDDARDALGDPSDVDLANMFNTSKLEWREK